MNLIVTVTIAGVVVARSELSMESLETDPRLLSEQHVTLCAAADHRGEPWLVEVFDPDAPAEEAYLRFGSDTDAMVEPTPIKLT